MTKKHCSNCIGKKEKSVNSEDLPPKCIYNGKYSDFIYKYFINLFFQNVVPNIYW